MEWLTFRNTSKLICFTILIAALLAPAWTGRAAAQRDLAPADITRLKQRLLNMINNERQDAGLRPVEIDGFATEMAERHCREMLDAGFTSHWNQAGHKPYLRYGLAGGIDAVQENVCGKWSNSGIDALRVPEIIEQFHIIMYNERPPNDSHRRTILAPQHTHVGIALAYNNNAVYYAEEFIARYIEFEKLPRRAKRGETITVKGELLYEGTEITSVDLFYEPFPQPLTPDQLNRTGLYSFPKDRVVMRPKLPPEYSYQDGGTGDFPFDKATGKFSCPVTFKGERGLYTIIVWVGLENRKFPAANIVIEVR